MLIVASCSRKLPLGVLTETRLLDTGTIGSSDHHQQDEALGHNEGGRQNGDLNGKPTDYDYSFNLSHGRQINLPF